MQMWHGKDNISVERKVTLLDCISTFLKHNHVAEDKTRATYPMSNMFCSYSPCIMEGMLTISNLGWFTKAGRGGTKAMVIMQSS